MRRDAQASPVGSTDGSRSSRSLAPAMRLIASLALAVAALFALAAPSAFAATFANTGTFAGPRFEGAACPEAAAAVLCTPGRAAVEQSTGNLFVVDSGNNRVQVFKPNDSGADYLTQFGSTELSAPWGIAIDENAGQTYVYVADAGNDEIVKYDSDEAPIPTFTVDPDFTSPSKGSSAGQVGDFHAALAIDPTTHDLLVADAGNDEIERFEADGTPGGSFDGSAGSGSPGAFTGPIDVAVNSTGDVYVIDATGDIANAQGTSQTLRYSASGEYKATLATVGERERVATVAVNPLTDEVLVSGSQDAIYEAGPEPFVPTLGIFDSANDPVATPIVAASANWDIVSGVAIASGSGTRLYVVFDLGLYETEPYGSPQIQAFAEVTAPPVATIATADGVAPFSATLRGEVNPEGATTACHFEYSTDTSFNKSIPCAAAPGSGTSPVPVHADVSGLAPDTLYHFRLVASSFGGTQIDTSGEEAFTTTHAELPAVTLAAPGSITSDSAHLSGTVDPLGNPTTYSFEYQLQGASSWTAVVGGSGSAGSGTGPVTEEADLTGLEANMAYNVRLAATNGAGTRQSSPQAFTTIKVAPAIEALGAALVTDSEALLRGRVNPNNQSATYHFEIGTTTAYGRNAPAGSEAAAGNGGSLTPVSTRVDGLSPLTTYHYRLIARNATGTETGPDRTFTTGAAGATCPNADRRAEGLSGGLPDCRAYEMVSPPNKNGSDIVIWNATIRAAVDGGAAEFNSTGAFGGSPGSPTAVTYKSQRGSGGWTTSGISAPQHSNQFNCCFGIRFRGFTDDLSQGFVQVYPDNPPTLAPGAAPGINLYSRDLSSGAYKLMTTVESGLPAPPYDPNVTPEFAAASADGSHVAFESPAKFTADATGNFPKAYEWANGEARLVGILPASEGGGPAPEGSMVGLGATGPGASYNDRAISRDGSRIFFTAPPASTFGADPVNPTQLYLREDGASTVRVSAPAPGAPSGATQGARYWTATPDGRYVFFTSSQKLTADSTAEPVGFFAKLDLYRFDVQTGDLIDLSVSETGVGAGVGPTYGRSGEEGGVIGISNDGSRVYFAAQNQILDGEPNPSGIKIYRWDEGEGVTYIATTSKFDEQIWFQNNFGLTKESRVTPSGRYMSFISRSKLDPNGDNGGHKAAYLYDADSGEIECASCPADGSAATVDASMGSASAQSGRLSSSGAAEGMADNKYLPRFLSDDGQHAFFMTADGLLPSDTNGVEDVYEWSMGRLSLISTGRSNERSFFGDASPSGDDVFIVTRERLSRRDIDNNLDVYDARVNGGLSEPGAAVAPCTGEACQGSSSAPPAVAGIGTTDLVGAGNARQQRPKAKAPCAKPKHKKHKAKKKKGAKKSAAASKKKAKACKRVAK